MRPISYLVDSDTLCKWIFAAQKRPPVIALQDILAIEASIHCAFPAIPDVFEAARFEAGKVDPAARKSFLERAEAVIWDYKMNVLQALHCDSTVISEP